MDSNEYRIRGKEMVDYVADYLENVRDRKVFPAGREPGFLTEQLPDSAPYQGEEWSKIVGDVDKLIMPGVTHWQSPHMHAYFPALTSYPSILGEQLSAAINCLGFTWASSPACTELEIVVMNWLAKMIGLPEEFMHRKGETGGGVIQTTASEATLVSLLASRWKTICKFKQLNPGLSNSDINKKLVAYASDQAHSSVLKAALIGLVDIRFIVCDDDLSMRGPALLEAIKKDQEMGRIPFWVCATLGTTGACAFDNLQEIGQVCQEQEIWLHVDAAFAGSALICPEFRGWLKGICYVDSLAFNPSKWLLVNFDCTAMWVRDSCPLYNAFNVNPLYLVHKFSGVAIDFTDWQIPLSRRFRALKLWFVIRNYGIKGLQDHIRKGVALAQKFESLVRADKRFEVVAKRHLNLVVFRLAGDGECYEEGVTERLLQALNQRGKVHCIPSKIKSKFIIRFTVTSPRTTEKDILEDWQEIQTEATKILDATDKVGVHVKRKKFSLSETKKHDYFGTSLLLSNTPMSPKIVNGSFAAVYKNDLISEFSKSINLREDAQNSPAMRRRIRGILMSGKQFSLDSRLDLVHGVELRPDQPNLSPLEDETEDSNLSIDSNFLSMEHLSLDGGAQRICKSQTFDQAPPGMLGDDDDRYEKNNICQKCGHPTTRE